MRVKTIGLLLGFSLILADVSGRAETPRSGLKSGAYEAALQFFTTLPPRDVRDAFRTVRPVALSAEGRARALLHTARRR